VELMVQTDAHDVVGSGEAINGPAAISGRSGFAPDLQTSTRPPEIGAQFHLRNCLGAAVSIGLLTHGNGGIAYPCC
jgi:hypothetical protein